jgi:ligand-binding SRPBCC domain-containing protein
MNIQLKTPVKGNYRNIMARFDRQLFEALAPKAAKMEIVAFTGSKKGDTVHIRFVSPIRADWVSKITEDGHNDQEAWFVDEGMQLPFPLGYWKHRHLVQKLTEDTSCIVDDITFEGKNMLWSWVLYPAIYLGFYPRKSIYQEYFGSP